MFSRQQRATSPHRRLSGAIVALSLAVPVVALSAGQAAAQVRGNAGASNYHQEERQFAAYRTTRPGGQGRSVSATRTGPTGTVTQRVDAPTVPSVTTKVSRTSVIPVGGTLTDMATLKGSAGTVTGMVDFYLCSNTITGCPQGTGTKIGTTKTLSGGSATSDSFGSTLAAGRYCVGVQYTPSRGSNYSSVYSGSAAGECFTVGNTPSITTKLSTNSVTVGGTVYDSAMLTGATKSAGGKVDYRYYDDLGDCQKDTGAWPAPPGHGTSAGTVNVTTGSVPNSPGVTFGAAGTYYWAAFYTGDYNNQPAASNCVNEKLTVDKKKPYIVTKLWRYRITVGTPVRDTARLLGATGNAGGKVYYRFYDSLGSCLGDAKSWTGWQYLHGYSAGTVVVKYGMVPWSQLVWFHTAGTYYWAAFYTGDYNNEAAASKCWDEKLTVVKKDPYIVTKLSRSQVMVGTPVRDMAWLHGASGDAGGKVYYRYYDSLYACLGDTKSWTGWQYLHGYSAGTVMVKYGMVPPSQLVWFHAAGTYYWAAFYTGDYNNQAAASNCGDEVLWVKPCKPWRLHDGHVAAAAQATEERQRWGTGAGGHQAV